MSTSRRRLATNYTSAFFGVDTSGRHENVVEVRKFVSKIRAIGRFMPETCVVVTYELSLFRQFIIPNWKYSWLLTRDKCRFFLFITVIWSLE